jgi:hypothetical protein
VDWKTKKHYHINKKVQNISSEPFNMAGRKSRAKYTEQERKEIRRRMMMDRWAGGWAGKRRGPKRKSNMSQEARRQAYLRMKANWKGKWAGKRKARTIDI